MRCIACDSCLTKKDVQIDDEMCRHCLGTIVEDIKLSSQLIEDEEEVEDE